MSLDIVGYYSQYALAMEGIIQDGYNNAIDSGQIEGFAGDAYRIGRHDGLIGNHYYWDESDCILIGNEDDHARLSARLDGNRIIFAADSALGWVQYLDLITGATYVDDVVVVGQRREHPSQPFPFPGTSPNQPGTVFDPCGSPLTAEPWNADAAAARSIADFLQKAAELGFADAPNGNPTLSNREFGRGLFNGPNNTVQGNPPSYGPPIAPGSVGGLTIDMTGITTANYHGDIHTHPNGNGLPSQVDWDGFMANNLQARQSGRVNDTFRMYIGRVGANGQVEDINVYEDGPRAANSPNPPRPTSPGEQVNPNAQPCP